MLGLGLINNEYPRRGDKRSEREDGRGDKRSEREDGRGDKRSEREDGREISKVEEKISKVKRR